MKKTVLTYGLIAGGILSVIMAVTLPLVHAGTLGHSEIIGYSSMILASIPIFLGIRSYRDTAGGGAITFGKAFTIGILIALIASTCYVITWEILYWGFLPDFAEKYGAAMVAKLEASGASAAKIAETKAQMAHFAEWYKNPFLNVGATYLEVFPVELIMTLVAAGFLRKSQTPV